MRKCKILQSTYFNVAFLCLLAICTGYVQAAPKVASISAELKVVLDDESCKKILAQIGLLQTTLEQMVAKEFDQEKIFKLRQKLTLYLLKICGFKITALSNAQTSIIKLGIALSDAMSHFIEEILDDAQVASNQVALIKQKALSACNNLKRSIQETHKISQLIGGASSTSIDQCYNLVAADIKKAMSLHPVLSLGTFSLSVNKLDQTLNPYTERFLWLFKQSISKSLSQNDINEIVTLAQSPIYTKIKDNIPGIIQICMDIISPETKNKSEGLFSDFWDSAQYSIINGLQNITSRLSSSK